MKVFAGLISLCAANAISNNKAADFDCVMDCYRNVLNAFSSIFYYRWGEGLIMLSKGP